MFSGIKLYAALGLLAVLLGLAGWGYIEHQRAQIAEGSVKLAQQETKAAQKERDDLADQLGQSEKQNADLAKQKADLDAAIVAQQKRAQELEHEKAQVWEQFDKLVKSQPKADQDCAARPLPQSTLDWLRDEPPSSDALPKGASPAKPAAAVS